MAPATIDSLHVLSRRRAALRWFGLAVASLILAGGLAVLLVIARMPPFDRMVGDPLFFRRCLVVHVDLALVVWFFSFATGLSFLIPSRRRPTAAGLVSPAVAALGVVSLVLGAGVPGALPVLSNYIPFIDHPLHAAGIALFFCGVWMAVVDPRLLPSHEMEGVPGDLPEPARPLLRGVAVALVLAGLTAAAAVLTTPRGLPQQGYYELLVWGAGHVLQFASVLAMVAIWVALLTSALGRAPLSRPGATAATAALLAPILAAPAVTLQGTTSGRTHEFFTGIMRWGIFPAVSAVLVVLFLALRRAARQGELPERGLRDPRLVGFFVSAGLTVLGFVLGAFIRGSNTVIPAHYHASIGAVTAAYMTITWVLLRAFDLPLPTARLRAMVSVQPAVFGIGQMVFAAGFAVAGAHGAARKVYGAEQHARSLFESVGLGVMGVGGLVAAAGGLLFLAAIAIAGWHRLTRDPTSHPWRSPWNPRALSTRSRS